MNMKELVDKKVIIYGAGKRGKIVLEMLKKQRIEPIAFCDANIKKVGSLYFDLPIFSKQQVVEKYGMDFLLYISPDSPVREECQMDLLASGFIMKDRIINFSSCKKYNSCHSLEHDFIISTDGIECCCRLGTLRNESPRVLWDETIEKTIYNFFTKRDQLIADLQVVGKKTQCTGCSELKNAYWDINRKVEVIAISPSFPCQLSCNYCSVLSNAKYLAKYPEVQERVKKINVKAIIEYLECKGKIALKEPIQVSAGEISIHPQKREILASLSKYPLQIFSNCVIYDEQISKLSARPGSFLNISLDSGISETYYRVKGLDVFAKVLNNIRRYKKEGANISMKYIILSENCGKDDLNGFIDFCKEIKIQAVNIACDISADHANLPIEIVDAAIYIAKRGRNDGINVTILPYFGNENMKKIKENL
jgi:hypothetical protein